MANNLNNFFKIFYLTQTVMPAADYVESTEAGLLANIFN